jgi:hypothetical protein
MQQQMTTNPTAPVFRRQPTETDENTLFTQLREASKLGDSVRVVSNRTIAILCLIAFFLLGWAFWYLKTKQSAPPFFWTWLFISIFSNKEENFKKKALALLRYRDMRTVGVVAHLACLTYAKSDLDKIVGVLQPLLEAIEPMDSGLFSERQREALVRLTQHRYLLQKHPDLIQAIIVALYRMHTNGEKVALEKIAKRKSKNKSDDWVRMAAQTCLDEWMLRL